MPERWKQHRTFHVNMHVVGKKNGSLRLCEDYQQVNAVTNDDPYPMPRVDDLVENIGKARYISN
jgi:hypothetical protein